MPYASGAAHVTMHTSSPYLRRYLTAGRVAVSQAAYFKTEHDSSSSAEVTLGGQTFLLPRPVRDSSSIHTTLYDTPLQYNAWNDDDLEEAEADSQQVASTATSDAPAQEQAAQLEAPDVALKLSQQPAGKRKAAAGGLLLPPAPPAMLKRPNGPWLIHKPASPLLQQAPEATSITASAATQPSTEATRSSHQTPLAPAAADAQQQHASEGAGSRQGHSSASKRSSTAGSSPAGTDEEVLAAYAAILGQEEQGIKHTRRQAVPQHAAAAGLTAASRSGSAAATESPPLPRTQQHAQAPPAQQQQQQRKAPPPIMPSKKPPRHRQADVEAAGRRASRHRAYGHPDSDSDDEESHPYAFDGDIDARHLTSKIKSCSTLTGLWAIQKNYGELFNVIHISAFIMQIQRVKEATVQRNLQQQRHEEAGRGGGGDGSGYDQKQEKVRQEGLTNRERSMVKKLVRTISTTIQDCILDFDGQGVVNTIYSFGRLGQCDVGLMGDLLHVSESFIPQLPAVGLSNVIYGLGMLGHQPERSWSHQFFKRSAEVMGSCTPQGLANTIWGLARCAACGHRRSVRHSWLHGKIGSTSMAVLSCLTDILNRGCFDAS